MIQKTVLSLLLVVFFVIEIFSTTLFEDNEYVGRNPKIVRFDDGQFIVAFQNGKNFFFRGFNSKGEKIEEQSFSIDKYESKDSISDYSVTKGVIDAKDNERRFYIFVTFRETVENGGLIEGEILKIQELSDGTLSTQMFKQITPSDNSDIINPKVEFFYYEYYPTNNGFSSDTILYLYELKSPEEEYYVYAKSFEVLVSSHQIFGESIFAASFFGGKSKKYPSYPTLTVSGSDRTEDNHIMVGQIIKGTEDYIRYGEFDSLINLSPTYINNISTGIPSINNLKIKTNNKHFYGFFCSDGNQIFGFAKNSYREIINFNGTGTGVNFDFAIHETESELNPNFILFYEDSESFLNTKYFRLIDGMYEVDQTNFEEFSKEGQKYQPRCSILSNNSILYVWETDSTTVNGERKDIIAVNNEPIQCEEGAENCECNKGYYNANSQDSQELNCVVCPAGYYKPIIGNDFFDCIECPAGTTTSGQEAATDETFCDLIDPIDPTDPTDPTDNNSENTTMLIIGLIGGFIGIIGLILILFIVVVIVFLVVLTKSQKKANRFDHIEGVDMILKEAELEQQDSKKLPKIKVSKSKYIVDFNELKIIKKIGEGASSSMVYLCDWNGIQCAFKGFAEGSSLVGTDDSTFTEFEKEVEICVGLNHPSILQFYGASITPKRIGLIVQYCVNGDLYSFLKNRKEVYPIQEKIRILKEITSGMDYLHNRKLIHRDLKPENVLLDENEKSKIMDFGLSKTIDNAADKTMTKMIGTVFYMSPEVIEGNKYSYPCDVYSWAILAYVIITEKWFPYGTKISQPAIMGKISIDPNFRPEIKKEDFQDFQFLIPIVKKCWNFKPEERYSFKELKKKLSENK